MMKWLRFNKKIWIPLVVILVAFLLGEFLVPLLPTIAQLGFAFVFQMVQVVSWIFLFFYIMAGRVRIKKFYPGDLDYCWDDYRGNQDLVEKMKAWVSYLQGDEAFEALGGEHEPGVLLEGPPGCGKTYLAKVLASESGVPLWSVDCQSLLGTFVGIGPLKVSGMFKGIRNEAIKSGKGAILFLDEIDSIGQARGGVETGRINKPLPMMGGMGGMGMGGQILNTILSELDGLVERVTLTHRIRKRICKTLQYDKSHWLYPKFERPRVMVICSTNRPDILDPALTRRGRIGTHIQVNLPTVEGLKDIAEYYLKGHTHPSGIQGVKHSSLLTADAIAKSAAGRSPADVKFILNSAVQTAAQRGEGEVTLELWMDALAEGTMGTKNPLPLSNAEKELLATHEAGHTIVMMALAKGRLEPMFLTIERYGKALGHLYPVEVFKWYLGATQEMLEVAVCISLAGAASEEVIAGERHNSLGGDMPHVWSLLDVMYFNGMLSDIPPVGEMKQVGMGSAKLPIGGEEPKKEKMEELWNRTLNIVRANKEAFEAIVPVLVDRKTMVGPEVLELLEGKIVTPQLITIGDDDELPNADIVIEVDDAPSN